MVRVEAPGETRSSLAVNCNASGAQYRFVLPGPVWTGADMERALAAIVDAAAPGGYAVLSGSLPPGLPDDLPLRLHRRWARRAADRRYLGRADAAAGGGDAGDVLFPRRWRRGRGAGGPSARRARRHRALCRAAGGTGRRKVVVLARGAEGNVLADASGAWRATAPMQQVTSAVGAGDTFVGAFVLALDRGESLPEALRHRQCRGVGGGDDRGDRALPCRGRAADPRRDGAGATSG